MAYTPPSPIPTELTEILQRMKDSLPVDLGYSHYGSNVLKVFASELSSLEEAMRQWFAGQFVATATGDNLKRWESLCGITPEPTGIDEDKRRDILTAHLAGRFNYSGKDFINNVARLAYGVKPQVEIDNVTGTATLTFAVGLNSFEVTRIVEYCQASGPAHYQWEVNSDDASSGFVVNEGLVGFTKI